MSGKLNRKGFRAKALAATNVAVRGKHELGDAPFHHHALCVREGALYVALCTCANAHVTRVQLSLESLTGFCWGKSGIDGNLRLFFSKKDPIAVLG